MSNDKKLSGEQIKLVLQEKYGCKYLGQCFPLPNTLEDDIPHWYETPSGHRFAVPADDGTGFSAKFLNVIIQSAKLDVVVKMPLQELQHEPQKKEQES